MKNLSIFFCIAFICNVENIIGQITDPQDFVKRLIENAEANTKEQWRYNVNIIVKANNSLESANDFVNEISLKLSANKELNDIADVINPSSKSLANKPFNEIISDKVTEVFVFEEGKDNTDVTATKDRLGHIIENLTDTIGIGKGTVINGIIRGLISSTPVLDMASKVIGGICTFFKSTKIGRANSDYNKTVGIDKVQKFKKEIQPYINFYDSALKLNREFGQKVDSILLKSNSIRDEVNRLSTSMKSEVTVLTGNPDFDVVEIENVFPFKFEELYFNKYNKSYYFLLNTSDSINLRLNEAKRISKISTETLNHYLSSFKMLKDDFTRSLQSKDKEKMNLALIDQRIENYNKNNATNFTETINQNSLKFVAFEYNSELSSNSITSNIAFTTSVPENKWPWIISIASFLFMVLGLVFSYTLLNKKIARYKLEK